ncbi:MAG: hypothetical protein RR348_06135 [Clostridia bacterium]
MKKKKMLICGITAIIITIVACTLLSMFLPRQLKNLVPTDNIVKIEMVEYGEVLKTLSPEEIIEFATIIQQNKYSQRFVTAMVIDAQKWYVYYGDKTKIEFSSLNVKKIDAQGNEIWKKKIVCKCIRLCKLR